MATPAGRRVAGALAAITLLLAAGAAHTAGLLVQRLDVSVSPAAAAPPITLGAGATGTTTLGASLTSASTTRSGLPVLAQEVLQVKKGASSWDVRIQLGSATGFGVLDSATVQLVLGAATQAQVVVTLGVVTQSTGLPVSLPAGGSDMSVQILGAKASGGSSVLAMTIVLLPTGGTGPALSYPYTLTIT